MQAQFNPLQILKDVHAHSLQLSVKFLPCPEYVADGCKSKGAKNKWNLSDSNFFFSSPPSKGMVDPGEKISATLKREFGEEALNSLQKSPEEKAELEKQLHKLFSQEHFVVSSVSLLIAS